MNTTTLFVELLIIGFEACVWLVFLISGVICSSKWLLNAANVSSKYAVLITALVFALAYLMGILIDKLAKRLIEELLFKNLLKRSIIPEDEETKRYQKMYAYVMIHAGQPMSDLLYGRSKVRILRASIVNLLLITLSVAWFLARMKASQFLLLAGGVGLILIVLSGWGYWYNNQLYQQRLQLFYEAIKNREDTMRSEKASTR